VKESEFDMTGTERWPNGRRAAVTITMDNMGEAAEMLRGEWPSDRTVGRHFSVLESLPSMLEKLSKHEVRATYFIESFNVEIYPDAIQSVRNAGHEVAFHGWKHEQWSSLEPEAERRLFEGGKDAFGRLGLTMYGFRPPGGVLTTSTAELMREFSYRYCSPAGEQAAIDHGIVYLPFDWRGIDAYYYSEGFAGLREVKGEQRDPMEPTMFAQRAVEIIEQRLESGGYIALLAHPHLTAVSSDRLAAFEQVLDRVANDDEIWCATGREVAAWITEHPERFSDDPLLDETTWSR
jgi:peptidoglycan/xylan/chitin deacetylase (PgdA/CDA1 family)